MNDAWTKCLLLTLQSQQNPTIFPYKRETKKMFAQTRKRNVIRSESMQVGGQTEKPHPIGRITWTLTRLQSPQRELMKGEWGFSVCLRDMIFSEWIDNDRADDDVLVSVRGGEDHKTSPVITEFRIAEVIIPTRKGEEEEKKVSIDVGSYSIESLHVMVNLSCKLDSIYLLGFLITWTTLSWCIYIYQGSMGAGEREIYNTTPVDM